MPQGRLTGAARGRGRVVRVHPVGVGADVLPALRGVLRADQRRRVHPVAQDLPAHKREVRLALRVHANALPIRQVFLSQIHVGRLVNGFAVAALYHTTSASMTPLKNIFGSQR